MENYYDMMIRELLGGGMPANQRTQKRLSPIVGAGMPQGFNEEQLVAGALGGGIDEKNARRLASGAEDVMLSGALGSERRKGENENIPSGSYALAEYPGLWWDIENAARGGAPRGGLAGAIPPGSEEDLWLQELRKKWAANQQAMMPQGNFVSRMGGW